jgi:Excalibur calcium-binding domain
MIDSLSPMRARVARMSRRARVAVAGAAVVVIAVPASVVAGSLGGSDQPGRLSGVPTAHLRVVGSEAAAPIAGSLSVPSVDYDCSDFPTQADAQHFFESHNPQQDPYDLDADGDGIACEDNPCPRAGNYS